MADSLERCPKCGMPYMGGMLSTETAGTRYCYTCDIEKGRNATAERAQHAAEAALDDLSLQNATAIDGKFAKRRVTNLRAQVVATARAKPKPQPQPQQPAPAADPQSAKAPGDLELNTVTSATSNPPPPPRKLHLKKRGSGPALPVMGILAAILLAFFVVKNLVMKSEPEAAAPAPVKTPPPKPKAVAAPQPKPKPAPPPVKEEKPAPPPDEYDIVTGKKLTPPAKPKQP